MRRFTILTCLTALSYSFSVGSISSSHSISPTPDIDSTEGMSGMGLLTRTNFSDSVRSLYDAIGSALNGLSYEVFRYAFTGFTQLKNEGVLNEKNLLTIIDFSRPGTEKRLFVVDLDARSVLFNTYVAHGRNTGENAARYFSNTPNSNQSSLGFTVTGETYVGSKGYSLRLDGMEESFNNNVRGRAIVIHAAPYATAEWIQKYGRLGRSQGCPALPPHLSRSIIDTIKEGTTVFSYYPDGDYVAQSMYLDTERLFEVLDERYASLSLP